MLCLCHAHNTLASRVLISGPPGLISEASRNHLLPESGVSRINSECLPVPSVKIIITIVVCIQTMIGETFLHLAQMWADAEAIW